MERLSRNISPTVEALGSFRERFGQLQEKFADARNRLQELFNYQRAQRMAVVVSEVVEHRFFDVGFCDVRIRVRFSVGLGQAGGAAIGRVSFLELTDDQLKPENLIDSVTFTRTGEMSVQDADGDPADLEDGMLDLVLQVMERVLRSRIEA